jgi:hypothetical protein
MNVWSAVPTDTVDTCSSRCFTSTATRQRRPILVCASPAAGFGDCCRLDPTSGEARAYLAERPPTSAAPQRPRQPAEPARSGIKVGRDAPCSCGSGRKHKKCCALATA